MTTDRPRTDHWKTFAVFDWLKNEQALKKAISDGTGLYDLRRPTVDRFNAALQRFDLEVDISTVGDARMSWDYYVTNLSLFSAYLDSYVHDAALELAQLCTQFRIGPNEVFQNDWSCISNRSTRFREMGKMFYYSHKEYISHLWVENVAARRLFFAREIQSFIEASGLALLECELLDVGCGMGGTLRVFQCVPSRVGIDISRPSITWCTATRQQGESFQVMDCRALNLATNRFDITLCFDVLEHIDDPVTVLRQIHRVTREAGLVSIVYPFGSRDWDSHISIVEKPQFEAWLADTGHELLAEVTAPGESYPCSVCYLLRAT